MFFSTTTTTTRATATIVIDCLVWFWSKTRRNVGYLMELLCHHPTSAADRSRLVKIAVIATPTPGLTTTASSANYQTTLCRQVDQVSNVVPNSAIGNSNQTAFTIMSRKATMPSRLPVKSLLLSFWDKSRFEKAPAIVTASPAAVCCQQW